MHPQPARFLRSRRPSERAPRLRPAQTSPPGCARSGRPGVTFPSRIFGFSVQEILEQLKTSQNLEQILNKGEFRKSHRKLWDHTPLESRAQCPSRAQYRFGAGSMPQNCVICLQSRLTICSRIEPNLEQILNKPLGGLLGGVETPRSTGSTLERLWMLLH